MHEESRDEEPNGGDAPQRHKAISPVWDRRQSALLVFGMGFMLTLFIGLQIFRVVGIDRPPAWFFYSLAVSMAFAAAAWRLRAATPAAALLGGFICLGLLLPQQLGRPWQQTAFPELALLFLLTFAATRFGRLHKESLGLSAHTERLGRRASQVMANLGIAGFYAVQGDRAYLAGALAALAEATADTVSSELGQVFAGRTVLITSGRSVPPGTDGAISLAGTACGVLSAALIAALAAALGAVPPLMAVGIFLAGTAGLIFDSLLGATLERWGWIGNDLVNFASTVLAFFLAIKIAHIVLTPLAFW